MKPEEKQASQAIQDVTGIGNTSAQAIISVIWNGHGAIFLLTGIFPPGRDYVLVTMRAPKSESPAKRGREIPSCVLR